MDGHTIACLTCRERIGLWRGLCSSCYKRHARAIKAGRTTWAALEAAGQAKPKAARNLSGIFAR